MNKTQVGGIIGVIALFASLLGQGFDDTYYCESRDILQECVRLSSTAKTCYTPLGTGKRCIEGGWVDVANIVSQEEEVIVPPIVITAQGTPILSDSCLIEDGYCYCNPRGLLRNKVRCEDLY